MGWKQSQSFDNSKRISRTIVVITPPQDFTIDNGNRKQSQSFNGLIMSFKSIKKKLDERIDILNTTCKTTVPYLNIEIKSSDTKNVDITELDSKDNYRMITVMSPNVSYVLNAEKFNKSNISHLIQINVNDASSTLNENINACYTVDEKDLIDIMVDILLDIAMYHSWFYNDSKDTDINFRRQISIKKVDFIKSLKPECTFKHSFSPEKDTYCCFALACYDEDNKFNYEKYEKLWSLFVRDFITDNSYSNNFKDNISAFKMSKQLSIKKLERQYEELSSGKYLLLVTHRKPRYRKLKAQIFAEMGFSKDSDWKTGRTKFLKFSEYSRIARWYPYVSLYIVNK